jgi:bifunctional N-acetylglucosamine-1-phosphate-uridyltransferase/glucosamine-1-phosphate-acetyltransferase GlmU-like protein
MAGGQGKRFGAEGINKTALPFLEMPIIRYGTDLFSETIAEIEKQGWKPDVIFIGNGDHMMFYDREIIEQMESLLVEKKAGIVMVTTEHPDPDKPVWGRVIRNSKGEVMRIVEQKDATIEERKITEISPNFYAFDYEFARVYCKKIRPSPVSHEYYINQMVEIAVNAGRKVLAVKRPFEKVGPGINTREELGESLEMYKKLKQT